jgi:hypothetical protein
MEIKQWIKMVTDVKRHGEIILFFCLLLFIVPIPAKSQETKGPPVIYEATIESLLEAGKRDDPEAIIELSRRAFGEHNQAEEFIRNYETSGMEKKALQGDARAVLALGNVLFYQPQNSGIKLVFKNLDLAKFERGICDNCDLDSMRVMETILAMEHFEMVEKTEALKILESLDPKICVEKIIAEGNEDAVEVLISLHERGKNAKALEALKTVSPDKITEKATGGSSKAVYSLIPLSYTNPQAKEALRTMNPQKLIEKAIQNDSEAYMALSQLAIEKNLAAEEALKTIKIRDPVDAVLEDAMAQKTSFKKALITLPGSGNSTEEALKEFSK